MEFQKPIQPFVTVELCPKGTGFRFRLTPTMKRPSKTGINLSTCLLTCGGSILIQSESLQAQSLSQTVWTTTPIADDTPTVWENSLSFPQFNIPGMRLNSATITFTQNLSTTFSLISSANGLARGSVTLTSDLMLTDPVFASLPAQARATISLSTGTLKKGASTTLSKVISTTSSLTFSDPQLLRSWMGVGSFAINLASDSSVTVMVSGGNSQWSLSTLAGATGFVTYEYIPTPPGTSGLPPVVTVPEPVSYSMVFAGGLLGLGFSSRLLFCGIR